MFKTAMKWLATSATFLFLVQNASAVPSFARQTNQECAACHIGAFGPQLTPYGQKFKLGGYTEKSDDSSSIPISAMLVGIYDKTAADLPEAPTAHTKTNNNSELQEASLFAAGAISKSVGGFLQVTYSGIDRMAAIDNLDLRYAKPITVGGEDAIFGVSLNNNPTNQDAWNTLPAWGFPYMAADLAPGPNGTPLVAGGLEQQVIGLSGYMSWNDTFYGELGLYRTQSDKWLKNTNVIESSADVSELADPAPYFRFTYSNSFDRQNFSVGVLGFDAKINPGRASGPSNHYTDLGIDASYQYLGTRRHIFTVNTSFINESQTLDAFVADGSAEHKNNETNAFNLNGSYYFENTYGLTLGYFNNFGSKADATLYGADPVEGSRVGKSDTSGYILQADYTPFGKEGSWGDTFANVRLGLQYIAYNKYNGSTSNYDANGRDAADNNTLTFIVWTAF